MTEEVEPHILELYQLHKKIGSGAYGHVWKVTDRQTKTIKALKKNFDAFSNSTDSQRTYREIMFLRQLRHPNIISLEKVIRARNDKDIYLVFQHMDIDLHTLIRQDGRTTQLQERHKQYIIYQIAKSIFYLHHSNLIHRDIKPSNILINENCEAKLCDFGLVRLMQEPADQQLVIMTDYIATRWYRAPELLLGSKDYNKEVDMWALGCLIGEMFYGKPMFPGTSTINQIEKVVAWTGAPTAQDLKHLNPNLPHNILQLLNTRKKQSKADFFSAKITPTCLDLISKLLQFNPSKRLSIEEVLRHDYLSQFYEEKQIKQIKALNTKIQLHINDNTKLSLKDYRELIYNQISQKKKVLTNSNLHSRQENHSKGKRTVQSRKMGRDKSKTKNTPAEASQKFYTFESTHSREDHRSRKDIKSSMEKSMKSRPDSRKKGISLCSKSTSKNHSLTKKHIESSDTYDLCRNDIRRIKPNSRSCTEKYDKYEKTRKITANDGHSRKKGVHLNECYVNQNIGRKGIH